MPVPQFTAQPAAPGTLLCLSSPGSGLPVFMPHAMRNDDAVIGQPLLAVLYALRLAQWSIDTRRSSSVLHRTAPSEAATFWCVAYVIHEHMVRATSHAGQEVGRRHQHAV